MGQGRSLGAKSSSEYLMNKIIVFYLNSLTSMHGMRSHKFIFSKYSYQSRMDT